MKTYIEAGRRRASSAHFLAISFLSIILLGTFALLLPFSTYGDIEFIDAAFTSVSAVCVTGLATVDVSSTFTIFGKIIIMILIQIGGLGIMTFAACAVWILREKLSVNDRMMLEYSFIQGEDALSLQTFIFFIMKYTFTIEFLGAVSYFFAFRNISGIWNRIFYAIFHAVSAFCNAGFSLFSDNFMRYNNSIAINLTTCALIILGGLGFIVVFELRNKLEYYFSRKDARKKYKTQTLTVHTWLVIHITLFLIIFGTAFIYFLQKYSAEVQTLTLLESFFQSVTCRTAGFNTVDIGSLHPSTLIVMMFLMFVGGSPGSTAGGIKTTTFGVLLYIIFLGRNNFESVTIKKRTIPNKIIYQAMLVMLFSVFIVFIAVIIMAILQPEFSFLRLLFEAISAFGTVGLTTGITPKLILHSKCILIATMFIGRIGSLSIFSIIASNREELKVKYAEEKVLIG